MAAGLKAEKDCVVAFADRYAIAGGVDRSANAEDSLFGGLGIRSGRAGGDFTHLRDRVRSDITEHDCRDVFIYLGGHGSPERDFRNPVTGETIPAGPAGVVTDTKTGGTVLASQLKSLIEEFGGSPPRATFKVKVEACFSGRFKPVLQGVSNLRLLLTSSGAEEVSYGALPPLDKNPIRTGEFVNGQIWALASLFTNANEVAAAQDSESMLAHLLRRAYQESTNKGNRGYDRARDMGLTHPTITPE